MVAEQDKLGRPEICNFFLRLFFSLSVRKWTWEKPVWGRTAMTLLHLTLFHLRNTYYLPDCCNSGERFLNGNWDPLKCIVKSANLDPSLQIWIHCVMHQTAPRYRRTGRAWSSWLTHREWNCIIHSCMRPRCSRMSSFIFSSWRDKGTH